MPNQISGITRDNLGNLAGSVEVYLLKYNSGTHAFTQIQRVVSDASTGAFLFDSIADTDPSYSIVAFKDDTPHSFDVSDRNIAPASTGGGDPAYVTAGSMSLNDNGTGTYTVSVTVPSDGQVILFAVSGNFDPTGITMNSNAATDITAAAASNTGRFIRFYRMTAAAAGGTGTRNCTISFGSNASCAAQTWSLKNLSSTTEKRAAGGAFNSGDNTYQIGLPTLAAKDITFCMFSTPTSMGSLNGFAIQTLESGGDYHLPANTVEVGDRTCTSAYDPFTWGYSTSNNAAGPISAVAFA